MVTSLLPTLLTTVLALSTTSCAFPVSASKPSPSTNKINTSSITASLATLIATDALASSNPNTCPPSHASKQCCVSVTAMGDELAGKLGSVMPALGSLKVTSFLGLQCTSMGDEEQNENCIQSVMCCSGNKGSGFGSEAKVKEEDQSLLKSTCISYDNAVQQKREAIEKSKAQASALLATSMSTLVAPLSTSMAGSSSSSAVALSPVPFEGFSLREGGRSVEY